jgi:hypothetical protein
MEGRNTNDKNKLDAAVIIAIIQVIGLIVVTIINKL